MCDVPTDDQCCAWACAPLCVCSSLCVLPVLTRVFLVVLCVPSLPWILASGLSRSRYLVNYLVPVSEGSRCVKKCVLQTNFVIKCPKFTNAWSDVR